MMRVMEPKVGGYGWLYVGTGGPTGQVRWPYNVQTADWGPALTKNELFLLIQCTDHIKYNILSI